MSKKRIISSTILVAMLLSQLAACGSEASSDDTTAPQGTDTTEPVAVSEYVAPDVNYGGATITVAGFDFDFTFAIAEYTVINHDEETGDSMNDAIVKMNRAVEEELGITFEFFPLLREDRFDNTKLTKSMYAGDDEIQIAFPLTGGLSGILAEPDILTDLNTIPTLDLSHSWWDQKSVAEYEIDGVQYTAVGDACFFARSSPVCMFFNKQLIDDNKLESPYQLVYDGKWTFDKMLEMSTAAYQDMEPINELNEKEDVFGYLGQASDIATYFASGEIHYVSRDENDNFELNFSMDKAAAMFEKFVPFIRNKSITLFAGDWYSKYKSPFEEVIMPAFLENRGLFYNNQLLTALDCRAMEADFGIIPLPKYDENQKDYYSVPSGAWCDCVMIPTTNSNLEQAGYILEAMGYYSQQFITPAFIDTTVFDKSVRDDDSAEMVKIILDNMVYDVYTLFDWGGTQAIFTNLINQTSTNLASQYEIHKTKIQEAMDKTLEVLKNN